MQLYNFKPKGPPTLWVLVKLNKCFVFYIALPEAYWAINKNTALLYENLMAGFTHFLEDGAV